MGGNDQHLWWFKITTWNISEVPRAPITLAKVKRRWQRLHSEANLCMHCCWCFYDQTLNEEADYECTVLSLRGSTSMTGTRQNENSWCVRGDEIFNLLSCLYYFLILFLQEIKLGRKEIFLSPLHHFTAEGCLPDLNKSGISPINDGKAKIQSFWTSAFTWIIESVL